MPDVHTGAGICIGYTAALNDFVVPNFIGVDIGCGLSCLPIPEHCLPVVFEELDKDIRHRIPHGRNNHHKIDWETIGFVYKEMRSHNNPDEFFHAVRKISNKISVYEERIFQAIGSLGGGNHFISVNRDENAQYFLVIHSGSRNFGKRIAEYHQGIAAKEIRQQKQKPTGFEFLTGQEKDNYLADMKIAQEYAALNRRMMLTRLARFLGFEYTESNIIESIHNYINFNDGLIRKGAISAQAGEKMLIPLSMADGILYCEGKGNPEWNFSAPHGAGRLMSRSLAKQKLTLAEYEQKMSEAGVWSSCIEQSTIDESPMAYKSSDEIKSAIGDTVTVLSHWKEVYNFKAAE